MKHTIFLSGPMRGYPNRNRQALADLAGKLRNMGHSVINPAEWVGIRSSTHYENKAVRELEKCTACVMLEGWSASEGATFEYQMARVTEGVRIIHQDRIAELA